MPILIFLHGLLGDKSDWQKVMQKLPHLRCEALDLPLHGAQLDYWVEDFEQTSLYLSQQIAQITQGAPYVLIGYSLGGRLALHYALQSAQPKGNLQALILEGANLGLADQQERQARWLHDQTWAARFEQKPIENVLQDWYQQPVFAHLSAEQRAQLVALRSANQGKAIAQMLRATSLAKQPDFRAKVRCNSLPVFYLVGEQDHKFRQLALQQQLNFFVIPQAGHNAHVENPRAVAQCLDQILKGGKS